MPIPRTHSHRSLLALALFVTACGDDGAGDDAAASTTAADSTGSSSTSTAADSVADTTTDAVTTTASTGSDGSTTGAGATLLERVATRLGGIDTLTATNGFELEVTGSRWATDEGATSRELTIPASDYTATIAVDLAGDALRLDIDRTLTFAGLGLPLAYAEIVAGELGYVDGVDNLFGAPSAPMPSDRVAATRRQQALLNPQMLVRAALADPGGVEELGAQDYDGRAHELLQLPGSVRPIVLWVDGETDEISRLVTLENNPLHRDVEIEVVFEDWSAGAGALAFPAHVTFAVDGAIVADETRIQTTTDAAFDPGAFALPVEGRYVADDAARGERNATFLEEFVSVGIPLFGEQTFVSPAEISPGVWHLTGGTHHSLVIEQSDGVVLVETPLAESRCLALLDWIATEMPDKPVTHAVVTHRHADHAACARTLVAEGATLVVGTGSEALWSAVLSAPSTVEPDALEVAPVADPPIEIVADDGLFTIDDAAHPVSVYDLPNTHADDMVLPFVDGIGFVADLYSPGQPAQLFGPAGAQAVVEALQQHGIAGVTEGIAGAHGAGVGSYDDLLAAAGG